MEERLEIAFKLYAKTPMKHDGEMYGQYIVLTGDKKKDQEQIEKMLQGLKATIMKTMKK